jgi:hypothetical protein
MWRACHDILPTMVNLFKRKVVETPLCPCCKLEEETIIHALWSCPASRDGWGCGPKFFQKSYSWGATCMEIVEGFMDRFRGEDMGLMAVLARRIWLRRNTLVFEGFFLCC